MAVYTFLAYDLISNTALAELPLTNVRFSRVLNGAGSLTGILELGDLRVTKQNPISATIPAKSALFVDRNGVLVWGGIIWTRGPYRQSSKQMAIGAMEFWSYFQIRKSTGRFIVDTKSYSQQDQLFIARDLVNYAQAKAGGNIGVVVNAETSGVLRDRTFNAWDFTPVAQAIEELAAVDNGFDFSVDVSYDGSGVPQKVFVPSYPRRGSSAVTTGLGFEFPGNLIDYIWPEDGSEQADTAYAIGNGQGASLLRSSSSVSGLFDQGFPLLEFVGSYKNETVQASLDGHAMADAAAHANTVILPELWVRADSDPVLGAYTVGDDVRIRIDDPARFPGSAYSIDGSDQRLDTFMRITAYEVVPPTADGQYEEVHLILGATG